MFRISDSGSDQKFEVGRSYAVNDRSRSAVQVIKRTRCYITLTGAYPGRYKIYDSNLFGLGENIWIPARITGFRHSFICSAAHAVESEVTG